MLLVMISMAGIPPSVGFFAKLSVLRAALDAGYTWLVVVAVLLSLVGAFYYLRVIKMMYMDAPTDEHPIEGDLDVRVLLSLNGVAILALGILPQPLFALLNHAVVQSLR
jgi:NADH-quinone oxidoreductase subunit N